LLTPRSRWRNTALNPFVFPDFDSLKLRRVPTVGTEDGYGKEFITISFEHDEWIEIVEMWILNKGREGKGWTDREVRSRSEGMGLVARGHVIG
jgi:hypothetical protein